VIARRYQLRKEAVGVVRGGAPWIFRDHLSSAANVFADGQWLRLVGGDNKVEGHGFYEATGAIAIRILRKGAEPPDVAWIKARVAAAVKKRAILATTTTGLRLVHGESDGLPAVVIERLGDTLVAQSYAHGADALARYVTRLVGGAPNVLLQPAHRQRRSTGDEVARVLRGSPPDVATFVEEGLTFSADLAGGQKTGTYLDLRGLRRAVRALPLGGARVLNLFSYTGMLGRAAETAGAAHITQVDSSERALAFAAAHHVDDRGKHELVTADVFAWLPAQTGSFDLVIVDPPSMTSDKRQVPAVLAGYRKLYRAAAPLVAPGGLLVAACCTSRVERAQFKATVAESLPGFTRERELPPEPDHPVGFREADYLKIELWRRGS
jgi:23S rRNA (cytosine1962-C5)-methyltransferase